MHRPSPRASSPLTIIAATASSKSFSAESRSPTSVDELPVGLRCAYRSKPCSNMRATKVNGDLHKLCDHHRKRANINQQRVHLRRRIAKKHARQLLQWSQTPPVAIEPAARKLEAVEPANCSTLDATAAFSDLTMQDLVMLEFILSYEPLGEDSDMAVASAADSEEELSRSTRLSFLEQLECVM